MADLTEPRIKRFTGLDVQRFRCVSGSDPYREKLLLAARVDAPFAYFDVDAVLLRRWDIEPPSKLTLARGPVWSICGQPLRLWLTGVMLVPDGCQRLFAAAIEHYDSGEVSAHDEGPLTAAIHALGWDVSELDARFNFATTSRARPETVVMHPVGQLSASTKLADVRSIIESANA